MKYGYARVSAEDQNPGLQLTALKKAGCKTALHRLLQVRTRVLNQHLRKDFERCHPQLRTAADPVCVAA
jgi:DNA invertase Pin-like site-specific DNA recombinase